jgi:broad specificity phosphatase PhoE
MAVHVLCVRHGLSTWNLVRRWQGTADPPLSDEGRAGAAELAAALAVTVGHGRRVRLWSSNLQRAHETARIIAAAIDADPVTVEPRLVEADVGEWQGLTAAEIEAGWPGYLAAGRRPPQFEPEADVLARVVPALEDIAATGGRSGVVPIVVAHAGVLRAVRRHSGAGDEHIANLAGLWFAIAPGTIDFVGLLAASHHVAGPGEERL